MAAYAALVSLLNNIYAVTKHPHLSTSLDNKQIQPLLEKTNFLLDFIEGNTYGRGSKEVQDLERNIAAAAHAAEDLIESHIVDQIHVGKSGASLACSLDLQQSIHDMDAVMGKVMQIKETGEVKEEISTHLAVAEPLKQSGESGMVGLDAELNQLLDDLTDDEPRLRVISIVGMGGIGKTTLAKNIYQNQFIRKAFHHCVWATISQQNSTQEVLSQLLCGLGPGDFSKATVVNHMLYYTLCTIKYFIVLDDIWSVQVWNEVKRFFPDNNNGSRILLTTRLSSVHIYRRPSSTFKMNLLDEENSWKLFCFKAFQTEHCPIELREVGEEIVRLCEGLPLYIVEVAGILLNSHRSVGIWEKLAENLKIPNSNLKQTSLDVLSSSYNHLPPHLKPCFLYMGVFKEGSEISISRIIRLWVAEGFIKPIRSQVLEEIAENYINDLIDSNLILVGLHHKNGKVRSCRIHPLLRDLAIKLAVQEEFLHRGKGKIQGTARRLVGDSYMGSTEVKLPLVRSIIAEQYTMQPTKHRLLRVLDERGFGSKRDYWESVNLRYLYIQQCDTFNHLGELPTSISLLWNLQILIFKSSFGPLIAPIEIWKMQQLRQVLCFPIYLPCPPPRSEQVELVILDNVHTLKTVVNFRLSEEVCEIIPNIKKLYLCYDLKLHGYDDSLIGCLCNLDHLQNLELLNLRWPISGGKLPTSFPWSLRKLSLSRCELRWDDMKIIGSLLLLEDLKLEDIDALGKGHWSPIEGQFRWLKFLLLKHCRNLVSWEAEENRFPALEKLILDGLWRLDEIPLGFGDISTLQLIDVDFCSISAAISAIRIKEYQLAFDDQLRVEVRVAEWHLDRFNQILEAEGLTIDNIHFKTFHDDTGR